jgi:hypothetical protein
VFYRGLLEKWESTLCIGLCKQLSFARLLTDSQGLPYVINKRSELHAQIILGFPQADGDVHFDSLLSGYFAQEPDTVTCKFNDTELGQAQDRCSKLKPPPHREELFKQQYRVTTLPLYFAANPLLYESKQGHLRRKSVHISMPNSINLTAFLADGAGDIVYDLVNVIVHVGSTGKPAPARLLRGQDVRLANAAGKGHYVMYAKVDDNAWYAIG